MKTTLKLTASGAVLSGLAAGSTAYNRWIDRNEETEPGATALRVALGTGYTLLGVALTVLVWRGWRAALAVLGWCVLCFIVAGAPMIAGDVRRDRW